MTGCPRCAGPDPARIPWSAVIDHITTATTTSYDQGYAQGWADRETDYDHVYRHGWSTGHVAGLMALAPPEDYWTDLPTTDPDKDTPPWQSTPDRGQNPHPGRTPHHRPQRTVYVGSTSPGPTPSPPASCDGSGTTA